MPTVTIRETYDLSTKRGKMTLIGIHTPSKNIIKRLYPGFVEQYKFFKIQHQNVRVASASRLPLDPAGIGANKEGLVSPEDVFNPILYKAVSNHSLTNLEYRIRGLASAVNVNGESVKECNDGVAPLFEDEFDIYYSLLSNTRGWKIAHPQAGLSMRKLRPLVYEKLYAEGVNRWNSNTLPNQADDITYEDSFWSDQIPIDSSHGTSELDHDNLIGAQVVHSMRGRPHRLPAMNTKYLTAVASVRGETPAGSLIENGMGDGTPKNLMADMPEIPMIYTGLILVPPSRNTTLYYRMVVETVVSFFDVQTMDEITGFGPLSNRTQFPVYWNDYHNQTTENMLSVEENSVSATDGSTIKKIMES